MNHSPQVRQDQHSPITLENCWPWVEATRRNKARFETHLKRVEHALWLSDTYQRMRDTNRDTVASYIRDGLRELVYRYEGYYGSSLECLEVMRTQVEAMISAERGC